MSETMDSGPDTESGPLLPGQSPMQTQQTQAPRRVTARKTARNTARDLQARQVTQDRRRSPRTVVVDDDDDDGDGKDDDDDDDDDGDDEDSNLDNHGDDAVIVEDDSAAVDESGRTSSASASASATASTAANTTEHRDHIAFIPHHDTVTCAGEDQYGDTTLCKDSICALAEFVDNSLTAVRKMKQKQIEIIVMREGDEPILAIVDSGTGMDKPDIQAFARYHYTTSHRRPDVTNEYPNPRVQFHHHYLNSGISHFGVGAKQAGFYLGNTLDVYTHTADSDTTLYFSMSKAEFDRLSESDENPFQGDVVSKPPVKSTLPKPVAEASALLDDIDTNKSKSYTCVVIRGLNANTLDVLSNMPRVAEELVNIYHYYIHGIPGNVPSDEMGKLSHPSYEHARKAMVPIEMTLCDVKPTPTSVDVHRLDLTTVQGDYETRCLRSAADFFNFSLTCERTVQRRKVKYEFEGQLRYHPYKNSTETRPMRVYLNQPETTTGMLKDSGPAFNIFWNGRLMPASTLQKLPFFSMFDRFGNSKTGNSKKLMAEVHDEHMLSRLTGTLWTGLPSTVNQSKARVLQPDLESALTDRSVVMTVRSAERNTQKTRDINDFQHFIKWLQSCSKYDETCTFESPTGKTEFRDRDMYFVYTKLRTPAQVYKAGTCVHRKGGDEFSGKITRFLVERMGGSGQKPPTSLLLPKQARAYAVVRLYPTDYHNNADRFVDLTRLSSLNVMTEHAFNIKMTHLKKRLPCRIVCRFYSDGKEFSPDEPIPLTDLTRGGKVDIQALFESASGDVLTEKKVYDGQEIRAQQEVKLLGESQYTPTQDMVVPSYTTKGDRNSERAKSERGFWFYTHVTAPCELLVACESSLVKEMYQQTLVFAAGEVANVKVDVLTPKVSLSDCIEIRCTYMDKNNNMCLLPDDSQLDRYIPEAFGDNVRTLTYSVPEDRSYITLEVGVQGKVDQQGTRAVIKLLFTHLNKEKTTKATLYPGRPRCVELCEGESPTFYNKQPLPPLRLKITDKYGNLCRFKRKELQPLLFAIQSKDIPDPMHIIYANSSGELVDTPAITFHPVVRAPKTMKIAIALLDAEKLRKTSPTSSVKTRADAAKIVDGRKCGLHATILPGPDPCIVRLALRGLAVDFSSDSLEVSKEELLELVGRSNETFDDIAVTVLTESGDEVDLGKVPHFKAEQGHKNVTKFVKQHGKLPALSGPSRAPGQHVHSFTFRLGDTRVSAHVQIVAEPGALAQLQVHGQLGEVHRRMTVSKANPLVVRGLDEDENTVPLKAEDIDLTGDINNTTMKKEVLKTGEVALYGFSVNSSPGQTQLDVHNTAANLHTKHALQVLPGIPHAVAVFEQGDESAVDPGSELTVEANAELFSEIRVRVVDADGHHCTYLTSGVVAITTSKKDINLTAEPSALQTQLHDAEATFKHVSLSGKPGTTNIIFHLKTSAPVAGGSKTKFKLGGALRVRMTEDMSTPAKIKFPTAENDELPAITAGEAFSFPVQVVSKGGDVVMPSVLEQLGFSLAAKGLQAHMNSTRSVLLACSPSEDNINLIVQAPDPLTTTGRVAIKLQLRAGKKRLTAKTVVAVHPSAPVAVAAAEGVEPASVIALAPNGSPGRLFPSVTFLLKDQYGNTVPAEADMPCRLSLQQENGEGELELQPTTTPFSNSTQVNAVARTAFPPGQYTFTAAGPEGVKPLQRIIQVLDSRKDAKVSAQQRHEKKLVMDNLNRSLAQQQQKLRATKAAFEKFSQLRKIKATIEDILRHHIRSRRRTALRAEDLLRHPDACAELIAQRTSSRRRGGREPQQVPARFRGQDVLGFVGELLEAEDQMSQRLASYALGSHINSIICVRRETALKLQRSYSVRDIERLPRQPFRQDTPSAVARFGGRALSSYITPRVNDERLFGLLNRMLHGLYVFKDMDTAVAFRDARDQADRADSRRSSRGQPTARELSFRTLFTQDMRKVDSLGFFGGRSGQVPPLDKLHGCVWLKAEESNELRALRAAQPYCDNFFTVQAELADFDKDEATLQREIESLQAHGQALMTELRNIGGLPTDPRTQRPQAAAPHASGGDGNPQKRHKP